MIHAGNQMFTGEVTLGGQQKNLAGKCKATKASFVVGAEAANVINVAIKLLSEDGTPVNIRTAVPFYLSSDATGDTLEGSGPDTIAIGTDGVLIKSGGDSLITGTLVSEVDGDIDVNLTHAGADTFYLNLVIDGRVFTSGAITMDATT